MQTFLGAKRLECAELAPAFRVPSLNDSASKLDALIVAPKLFTGGEEGFLSTPRSHR